MLYPSIGKAISEHFDDIYDILVRLLYSDENFF